MTRVSAGVLPALIMLLAGACESVEGGAVEVSWALRSQAGYALGSCDCSHPPVARMRLSLTPVQAETTEAPRTYEFACERNRSATPYEVPPGRYHMQLLALDPQGEVAAGVITPPPQTRNVVWGQPSSLDAQLVVAPCAERCANKNGNCSAK